LGKKMFYRIFGLAVSRRFGTHQRGVWILTGLGVEESCFSPWYQPLIWALAATTTMITT
jgi:hypothetical protein